MIDEFDARKGCALLAEWQRGDQSAKTRLKEIFDAAIAGDFDADFSRPAPLDNIHVGGSLNLMTLTVMHDLYGYDSAEFYKGDPERYVRTTLASRRMLGMNKLYVSWPVYGFTAEALGQAMMYPDKFPPGSDPEVVLINRDNWRAVTTPDFTTGIPKIIDEMIDAYQRLTNLEPILHLSAPYSLAADTFGQEPLLAALVNEPELANALLDHLVDHVLGPWVDHFFARHPNGWVELSDASGSPFFIGPQNCRDMAIRSIKRLIDGSPMGHRIYDANFRGDYVTTTTQKNRATRRRASPEKTTDNLTLMQLTDLKHSVCRDYIIRLDDDRVPMKFYEEQAIARKVPLFAGIGASQIDRNSIENLDEAITDIQNTAEDYVAKVAHVAQTIAKAGYENRRPPWPGMIYFEDISSESNFDMIRIIVNAALKGGGLTDDPLVISA